jgi:protein-S-isoprenylcysteine O-methyltransferase Ste14
VGHVDHVPQRAPTSFRIGQLTRLVTHGPFALTRNPIYVGNTIAMLGLALVLRNGWMLAAALPRRP